MYSVLSTQRAIQIVMYVCMSNNSKMVHSIALVTMPDK